MCFSEAGGGEKLVLQLGVEAVKAAAENNRPVDAGIAVSCPYFIYRLVEPLVLFNDVYVGEHIKLYRLKSHAQFSCTNRKGADVYSTVPVIGFPKEGKCGGGQQLSVVGGKGQRALTGIGSEL